MKTNVLAIRMENQSLVASVLVLSLLCPVCVTGRLERGRSLNMPESCSRSSTDLLTSKSAHALEELCCSLFSDRRKQNWLVCSANPWWLRGSHPALTGAVQAPAIAPDIIWGAEPPWQGVDWWKGGKAAHTRGWYHHGWKDFAQSFWHTEKPAVSWLLLWDKHNFLH